MNIIQMMPDTRNTIAVFEVSEKSSLKLRVICWALIDGYIFDGEDEPALENQIIGMVRADSSMPVLMTVDEYDLKFIGYVTGKPDA